MNNALKYKGYYGTVEYLSADNVLFGKVIGISGLVSYEGESISSLKRNFEEAVDEYLDMCAENGIEPSKIYKGSFNVRISPELHKTLDIYSASRNQSLNATVEEAVRLLAVGSN